MHKILTVASPAKEIKELNPWILSQLASLLSVVCAKSLHSCLTVISWTVAQQAPSSMGFSKQECWSGLPCPPPGYLPNQDQTCVSYVLCIGRWVPYHYRCLGKTVPNSLDLDSTRFESRVNTSAKGSGSSGHTFSSTKKSDIRFRIKDPKSEFMAALPPLSHAGSMW